MKMRVFDRETLLLLNQSSIQAGRSQNLSPRHLPAEPPGHCWVNAHMVRERDGQQEVRLCIVLDPYMGKTAWLDVWLELMLGITN